MEFFDRLNASLRQRKEQGNYRSLPMIGSRSDRILFNGVPYIDLAGNDYLGIASDGDFFREFIESCTSSNQDSGDYAVQVLSEFIRSGSSGSRLLTGNNYVYSVCESLLLSVFSGSSSCFVPAGHNAVFSDEGSGAANASAVSDRDCLYIGSGFDANAGVISTLFGEGDLILADKLSHASIIDGMLRSKAKAMRFAHNDTAHLESLLERHASSYRTVVIITEGIFSMDGDKAPLDEIAALKKRYDNVLIYIDEAHSFGVLGDEGLGLAAETGHIADADFIMGTLSKAVGSHGAFLICPRTVKEYLVNNMREFIFSTALPPVNVAFSMYVTGMMGTPEMRQRREYLKKICDYVHLNLMDMGLPPSESQIQPLITGDNEKAALASKLFAQAGLLALPVRYPTVPVDKVRLRISLSSKLSIEDADLLCALVRRNRSLFQPFPAS